LKRARRCVVSPQSRRPHVARGRRRAQRWMPGVWQVDLKSRRRAAVCPSCQQRSSAGHSLSRRTVADCRWPGPRWACTCRSVVSSVGTPLGPSGCWPSGCPPSAPSVAATVQACARPYATSASALGGRAGARLGRTLGRAGSDRTILRLGHGAPFPRLAAPRVIGLDAGAWRRGRRVGTIVCALERHHVLDLLPARSALAVAQGRQAHPSVAIVGRDRSRLDAEGIRHGAPHAGPVVERCHLVQNRRDALARFCLRHRRDLKALGAARQQASALTPTPAMLSPARHARGVPRDHHMRRLPAQRLGVAAIARRVQVSRPTVDRSLAMSQPPQRQRSRHRGPPLIAPFTPSLRRRWHAGCRNAQPRWRELVAQGHQPARRTVARDVGQRRRETGTRLKCRPAAPAPL
jgi:hypothetical protein